MKKIRKIVPLILVAIMMFSLLAFSGCGEPYEFAEGDFELTIEVDRDTFALGENTTVTATLKNLSGRSHRIAIWESLMTPFISGRHYFPWSSGSSLPSRIDFELDEEIQWSFQIGDGILEPGIYELYFKAGFTLNWRFIGWLFSSCDNGKTISLTSNTIILTVYEN